MREIGDRLRRAREEKGISLDQIQNSTKVRLRYLQALEEGDFAAIPGEVYVRGFLQNYAAAVGLDPHAILEHYDKLRSDRNAPPLEPVAPPEPPPTPKPERPKAETHTAAGAKGNRLNWRRPVLAGLALVVLVTLIILGKNALGGKVDTHRAAAPETRANRSGPAQGARQGVRLTLNFVGRCWILVRCDGKGAFEGILEAGTVKSWSAKEDIQVQLGNAGGVRAEVNGTDQGLLGLVGENKTVTFTP